MPITCHNSCCMGILFRYITYYTLLSTVFITCGLIGFVWIAQSLKFVEMIVKYNISLFSYLKLALYLIPDLFAGLLPISLYIGSSSAKHYLTAHQEWKAFHAIGMGPKHLYKPFGLTSLIAAVFVFMCSNTVTPWAFKNFKLYEKTLKSQWQPTFQGSFQSVKGVTIYAQNRNKDGVFESIFIDAPPFVFMAKSGKIVKHHNQIGCHMVSGFRLERRPDNQITQLGFDDMFYDLTDVFEDKRSSNAAKKPVECTLIELLFPEEGLSQKDTIRMKSEGHQRIIQIILIWIGSLLAFICRSYIWGGCGIALAYFFMMAGLPIALSIPWGVTAVYLCFLITVIKLLFYLPKSFELN